jgi:hypothetical protein
MITVWSDVGHGRAEQVEAEDDDRDLCEPRVIRGADRCPFEFARVQLVFGEHLRRTRTTSEARVPLGAALGAFRALGARPWADRAANELRVAKATVTLAEDLCTSTLTAQERRIASLAAPGWPTSRLASASIVRPGPSAATFTGSSRN